MSIRSSLAEMLKTAIRDNDVPHKNVIRCLRAKAEEHLCAKNMPRDLDDDAIYMRVVETYRKAIANALAMLEKNPRGRDSDLAASYRFEIAFCDGLLPKGKDEAEVLPLVRAKIAELSAGPGQIGKVVGAVMKDGHQGVSASMVKRLATQLLAEKNE
jgi:uncharacterized protein YqeY